MAGGVSVFQIHHGLAQDLASNDVIKLLTEKGLFDINSNSNLVALSNDGAPSTATGIARHASSHEALRIAENRYLTAFGARPFDATRSILSAAQAGDTTAKPIREAGCHAKQKARGGWSTGSQASARS